MKEEIIQIDELIHTEKYRKLTLDIYKWVVENNKEEKCNKLYKKLDKQMKKYSLGEVFFVLNSLELNNLLEEKDKFLEAFERGKLE